MRRVFADYERAKDRAGRIDFDDLLARDDRAARDRRRGRRRSSAPGSRWFSVDEYQDTNPHQQRLLELWAGDRDDICVVGDEDQTIYTFTGATSSYLTGFADRHSGRPGRRPDRELPLDAPDPRPRQPAPRRGRPLEGA